MPFQPGECVWQDYNLPNLSKLPHLPGMYMLGYNKGANVIYVGKAKSVKDRLMSYGRSGCHNKWIKSFAQHAKGTRPFVTAQFAPVGLQFTYRLTPNPPAAEAVAMQVYRTAIEGFNQRSEWKPIGDPTDQAYQIIVGKLKEHLPADQRKAFDQWLDRNG
jgi:hypothetical protein